MPRASLQICSRDRPRVSPASSDGKTSGWLDAHAERRGSRAHVSYTERMVSAAPVKTGEILAGKYRVERVLGMGGMGVAVAATHLQLDQMVALKFMLPHALANQEQVSRFLREARAAACGLKNAQNVARIIDVGTLETGSPYIVMEYLEGTDLAGGHQRDDGRMSAVAWRREIVLQACDAVSEAHALGIIHRDLKPANLFLAEGHGGTTVVKVLDFGISKAASNDQNMTRTASILGSPAYMPPEQMRAAKQVDARADIWSLGVILYEAVAGRMPFYSEVFTDLCLKVMMDPPPPLDVPGVPEGFEAVILRCLEKDPNNRYPSVGALATALSPFAELSGRMVAAKLRGMMTPAERAAAPTKPQDVTPPPREQPRLEVVRENTPSPTALPWSPAVPVVQSRQPAGSSIDPPWVTGAGAADGRVVPSGRTQPSGAKWRGAYIIGGAVLVVAIAVGAMVIFRQLEVQRFAAGDAVHIHAAPRRRVTPSAPAAPAGTHGDRRRRRPRRPSLRRPRRPRRPRPSWFPLPFPPRPRMPLRTPRPRAPRLRPWFRRPSPSIRSITPRRPVSPRTPRTPAMAMTWIFPPRAGLHAHLARAQGSGARPGAGARAGHALT